MKLKDQLHEIVARLEASSDENDEKRIWDVALDLLELLVDITPTRIDNIVVRPLIAVIRRRFDIPDND